MTCYDAGAALEAATDAYEHGVYPGDESEATRDELREMARRVLVTFLDHMSREYSGDMTVEQASGYLAHMVRDA